MLRQDLLCRGYEEYARRQQKCFLGGPIVYSIRSGQPDKHSTWLIFMQRIRIWLSVKSILDLSYVDSSHCLMRMK
ncbi:hypothetical protein M378DRAFT_654041 [Amanita muscaria Koide BX008]|uniref:Uncharacterized protein n=1 Tax=Amanita muscaria (strain Koide BX008) TaxID=946122 RepID=A0A0C2X4P4_AMAMK|nr:hypothetical protein M378DRAFT_654041 [Amanita muscaria Koide BX008]